MTKLHPKKITPRVEEAELELSECVEKFTAVFDDLKEIIVCRSAELDSLKLCVLLGEHLMLEGPPGTAKSDLATEFARRITHARFYKELMMTSLQTDQIFGPIVTEEYKKGIWRHNTEGMLPRAHFACLEEVYRAPQGILNALLMVINERIFKNAGRNVKCPLITCVGTTNFLQDNEEMQAFNDRWFIWHKVSPLAGRKDRITAAKSYMRRFHSGSDEAPALIKTISLYEIQRIRQAIDNVVIPEHVFELFEDTVRDFRQSAGGVVVSDRRYCHAIRVIQASAVLRDDFVANPNDIEQVFMPITGQKSASLESAFKSSVIKVVGEYAQASEENAQNEQLEKLCREASEQFDDKMPLKKAKTLFEHTTQLMDVMKQTPPDQRPNTVSGREKFDEIMKNLESLNNSLAERINRG